MGKVDSSCGSVHPFFMDKSIEETVAATKFDLRGKVVVITGSTGEMGEVMARRMAGDGASVVVSGRNEPMGERIASEINADGGRSCFIRADVSDESDCRDLISRTIEEFGRIDTLVNNAAHLGDFAFETVSADELDQVFATNIRGPILCTRNAIPQMKKQGGGSIINIGTVMVYRGGLDGPAGLDRMSYFASKGALLTFSKATARALAKDQIRSNLLTVGWIGTRGEVDFRGESVSELESRAREIVPMGRLGRPEEIASSVAYLASDEAKYITGCELNISGGLWV